MVRGRSQLAERFFPWRSGIQGDDKSTKDFDWEVKYNRLILRFLGLWPIDDRFRHPKFLLLVTLLTIYALPLFARTMHAGADGVVKSMIEAIPLFYVIVHLLIFKLKSDKVETILIGIHENWECSVDVRAEHRKPMIVYGGLNRLLTAVLIGILFLVWLVYLGGPVVRILRTGNPTMKQLPLQGFYPFPTDVSPNYEIVYMTQCLMALVCCAAFIGPDAFFMLAVFHTCAQLAVLSKNIANYEGKTRHVPPAGDNSSEKFKIDCPCLKCIVDNHVSLSKFVETVDEVFSSILMSRFIMNTILCCGLGYSVIESTERSNLSDLLLNMFLFATFTSGLFLYCWISEQLIREGENVGETLYGLDWYKKNFKIAQTLLLPILRSRKPLKLTAGKLFVMSLECYKEHSRRHRDFATTPSGAPGATTTEGLLDDTATQSALLDQKEEKTPDHNPCLDKYCGAGRECRVSPDGGVALCICAKRCARRHRPVCGSDGKVYANHCELHRAACNSGSPLTASRLMRCLHRDDHRETPKALPVGDSTQPTVSQDRKDDVRENLVDNDTYGLEDCSAQEYEIMKDNLLLYNHARLMTQDNHSKEYLVSIMFSHYDQNNNGNLEREELEQIAEREDLEQLSRGCSLGHMISYDDADKDGRLNINEFYMAFSKLYSVSVVSLDKSLEINHISVRVGDNVEIKCDVTGSPPPPLVWRRNDADLETLGEQEIRVFNDGSLYLTRVQLVHAGNYTCHALRNKDVVQTHILTVHTIPEVRVTPRLQSKRPGEEATMSCHVVGEPLPRVEWLKNDEPLHEEDKYEVVGNGTKLIIRNIGYADTGAYMCQATSVGGLTRDISSLVIQEQPTPTAASEERRFFSFHEWGISVYEPSACRLYHRIQSTDIIPGTQEYVCGEKGTPCSWGRAINVANRYVYVTQPDKDRILVISKIQMVVVDVVATDKYPVELQYVPALDQVWVLNWRSERDIGIKTVQVIRDAAQKRKHHTVHPEPIDGQFDLVRGLYIPRSQDIGHMFKYGYVTHTNQRGMYKLDLANMRYTRSADLAPYNCVPANIQFPALYGFVILQCEEPVTGRATGQLLLDYLTDTVLSHKPGLVGKPMVSPDSRHVVTLDKQESGVTLVVQEILPNGLKFAFDVKTTLNISDITFYPSQTTHGYDLYASSTNKEDILFLNLATGKVEMITGVGKAMSMSLTKWGNPNRPIVQSGIFGRYMVSPSNDAVFVLNGETRTVNCEIGGLVHPDAIVWFSVAIH